MSRADV
jgi:hypothetical protein